MKIKLVFIIAAALFSQYGMGGQDVIDARSDAMGGTGIASASLQSAAWINPALMSLAENQKADSALLIPVLGAEVSDQDNLVDKFDILSANYDALDAAIDRADVDAIDGYRNLLLADLKGLDGSSGYVSGGFGASFVMPSSSISWGIYYKTFLDAIVVADISDQDLLLLETLDPDNPPSLDDLTSQGRVIAGAQSELAIALSMPLSIVNMPVTVGLTPKLQRIDTFNYGVSANNFDTDDFDADDYRVNESGFNLDAGLAIRPVEQLTLGLVGRNLIKRELEAVESEGVRPSYRVGPMVTLGGAYQLGSLQFTTDLDLTANDKFVGLDGLKGTKYWRVGGEWQPFSWLALRAGYRSDVNDMTSDIYSLGTGFHVGSLFKLDLSGMWGDNDTLGAALQTSYHF